MNSEIKFVYFRLDSSADLLHYPSENLRALDWHADLETIRRFYRHFTNDIIDPPDDGDGCGEPLAIIVNGEIASFAIPFSFKEGEIEIGAAATLPQYQNRGFCRAVISGMARRILARGLVATLTTGSTNYAMRAAAKAIGMHTVLP